MMIMVVDKVMGVGLAHEKNADGLEGKTEWR